MVTLALVVPPEIQDIITLLHQQGFEGYVVGGCVRDLLMNRTPKDWDVTTNATPQDIQKIFEHTFYENQYGTVGVVNDKVTLQIQEIEKQNKDLADPAIVGEDTDSHLQYLQTLQTVEVTPYRTESEYSDHRHPDHIHFAEHLSEDLSRRDFTINAMAYDPCNQILIDEYGGVKDLQTQTIHTVGEAQKRFNEDALRLMRAVRLATQLGFSVSYETKLAIMEKSHRIQDVSWERIRDELEKIVTSDQPKRGIELLQELQLLDKVLPEVADCVGVKQNGSHIYDVYEHILRTLQHAADKKWPLHIRLAALFHDISKPETRRWSKEKKDYTFYGHEVVGSKKVNKILKRLKYDNHTVSYVTLLVRWHMFFSDPDKISLTAVRRIIRNVGGGDQVWDLIKLRICDRIGMGRPKEKTYRLRQYEAMMDEAMRSPISVKDLKINGDQIINTFHIKPGPKIGWILHACMRETLHEPEKNNYDWLVKHVSQMMTMDDEELKNLYQQGKEAISLAEDQELSKIRKKHKVAKRV